MRGDHEAFPWKLAQMLGAKRLNNYAQGGSRSMWPQAAATGDGGFGWVLQQLARDAQPAPYVPRSQLVVDDQLVHDLAVLGSANPRPSQEAHRTKWSRFCSAAVFEVDPAGASHSSFAFTGTWADFTGASANSGTGFRYTGTIGDSVTWTVPADRKTENVVALGLFLNATHDLTVGVSVDGAAETLVRLQGTVLADQSAANKNMNVVLRFGRDALNAGLAANSPLDFPAQLPGGVTHTIKLTLRTQTVAGSQLCADYAQIEADPLDGPVILVPAAIRPPNLTNWNGFPHGPDAGTDPMTDAKIQAWLSSFTGLFAEFGPRMVAADGDTALAKATSLFENTAAQAHPNPYGHAILARTYRDALVGSGLLTSRVLSQSSLDLRPFWEPIGQVGRTIPFQNSWVNFGGAYAPAGAYRDLNGIVHLRGAVKNGTTVGAVIFTLPGGYRPAYASLFPAVVSGGGTNVNVSVGADGTVKFLNGGVLAGSWLDGISFPAEL